MAISVSYSEMQGSPSEGVARTGMKTAIRKLECAWTDRWTLMSELLAEDYENEAGTLMKNTGNTSAPFPAANTGATTVATYEKALVTANYAILEITLEEDEEGEEKSESIEPTAEFLSVDGTELRWTNNAGDKVGEGDYPAKLFVGFDYIYTKTFQETLPDAVLDLIGTVNVAAVHPTSEGMESFSFPAETLLYQPPSIQRTINPEGALTWTVNYRFTYKPNKDKGNTQRGWNYFFRTEKGAGGAGDFDKMFIAGGNQYVPYGTGDFTRV